MIRVVSKPVLYQTVATVSRRINGRTKRDVLAVERLLFSPLRNGVGDAYLTWASGPFSGALFPIHGRGYDVEVFRACATSWGYCGNWIGKLLTQPDVTHGIIVRGTSCVVPDASLKLDDDEIEDEDEDEEGHDEGAAFLSASSTKGGYSSQMWM
jgi:hypothetical protein